MSRGDDRAATYSLAAEADTLIRVQNRALTIRQLLIALQPRAETYLPDKALHTASTTVGLVESHLAEDLAAMIPTRPP